MKDTNNSKIKAVIMRRVWYSYIVSRLSNYATLYGFLFGVGIVMLVNLTSVSAILSNLLSVQLGSLPQYVGHTFIGAVKNGEFLTLLAVILIIYSVFSLRFYVRDRGRMISYA